MIYLNEVCSKLDEILNADGNPADFLYAVESVGYHADGIYDKKSGRNMIRVFVSQMGGTYNPVFGLGEATYTIPIVFYFPVRFKEYFFALDAYLHQVFVGAQIDYGTNSGKAISNLSVSQYGELQDLDFKEFKQWADSIYKTPIEVMETYMTMTVNLYLSTIASGFVYANEVEVSLSWNDKSLPLVFASGSIQSATQAESEQLVGDYESDGLPFSVAYGSSFQLYLDKNSPACVELLSKWFDGSLYDTPFNLSVSFPSFNVGNTPLSFDRPVYVASANMPIQKGQPLSVTLSFAKRYEA